MSVPSDLRYTKDHEWVRVSSDGTVTVGITDFAQGELGEIVFAEIPAKGKTVKKHETLCVIESTKAASDVYAPVGGTVTEGNEALSSTPNLVNSSPYQDGWMVKLASVNENDLKELLSPSQYEALVGK